MPKAVITLDEQQVTKLEQVIIDRDEKGAWELSAPRPYSRLASLWTQVLELKPTTHRCLSSVW